ncbi:MAG: Ig-like domain-containing protein [Candidatus Shapirobacteria bacterium]
MNENRTLYLRMGLIVLALGFTYGMAAFVVPKAMVTMTKAAPATVISLGDSRVLAEKILARADGKDKCSVNVFVMDKNGKGVPGKQVSLEGMEGILPATATTNNDGKATFSMTSQKEGTFKLTAVVGGSPLPREVKVTFRN